MAGIKWGARRALVMVCVAALLVTVGSRAGRAGAATASGCPSVGTAWARPGPFAVTVGSSGAGHTIYRPAALGSQGCARHPVIIWGNGTGGSPAVYGPFLRHLASHGFIVMAADTSWSGSGREMLQGITYLARADADAASPFAGKVDLAHVGASGHSQGGGGAIAAGADPRVTVTVPIQPGPQGLIGALHGPMLILGGTADVIVVPALLVEPRYRQATRIVAEYGLLKGANHFTTLGDAGGFRGPVTAWFRAHLMGDAAARAEFYGPACGQCASPAWARFERNAPARATPVG
jgi:hypothetical protein